MSSRAVLRISFCCIDNSDETVLDVVDVFDANAGTWHTAQLSVARGYLSATSLPSHGLALFAGGGGAGAFLWKRLL